MKFHPPNQVFTKAYRRILYRMVGGAILLLTTCGRKTGRPHTVGLQYERIGDRYFVGAADGVRADWYRNIHKHPQVEIQVGAQHFIAQAEVICDREQITDFLEYRLKKRPLMIVFILRLDGLKGKIDRMLLRNYAERIGLVIFIPQQPGTPEKSLYQVEKDFSV